MSDFTSAIPPTPAELTADRLRPYMEALLRLSQRELARRQEAVQDRIRAVAKSIAPANERAEMIQGAEVEEVLLMVAVDWLAFPDEHKHQNIVDVALDAVYWRTGGKHGKRAGAKG